MKTKQQIVEILKDEFRDAWQDGFNNFEDSGSFDQWWASSDKAILTAIEQLEPEGEKSVGTKGKIDRQVDRMLDAFEEHTKLNFMHNPSKGFDHSAELREAGRKFREYRMELDELLYTTQPPQQPSEGEIPKCPHENTFVCMRHCNTDSCGFHPNYQ